MNEPAPFGSYNPSGLARWIIERTQSLPNSWLGRRLYVFLRRIATPLLRRDPLDVERLGARMRLYPYNNICDKKVLFTPQFFDPEELEILGPRVGDGFTFIDIGANIGAYALFVAARAGQGGRVLAVEPQPDVFDRLTENIRLNPFGNIKAASGTRANDC